MGLSPLLESTPQGSCQRVTPNPMVLEPASELSCNSNSGSHSCQVRISGIAPQSGTSNLDLPATLDVNLGRHEKSLSPTPCDPKHYYVQPLSLSVSIRSIRTYQVLSPSVATNLYFASGPIFLQQRNTSSQQPYFRATKATEGYGFSIIVTSVLGRGSFTLYFCRKTHQFCAPSVSIQWNLSFPTLVQNNAKVMQLARMGDVPAIRKLFLQGKARPSDVMRNGQGLLHVRLYSVTALAVVHRFTSLIYPLCQFRLPLYLTTSN
jgi:hypothetical protein